ncbi:hypothetical protein SNEBB_011220 [Seison nebaliae]|nr:hypothetical protein SNEBB_011220 [Seison nebaliae]
MESIDRNHYSKGVESFNSRNQENDSPLVGQAGWVPCPVGMSVNDDGDAIYSYAHSYPLPWKTVCEEGIPLPQSAEQISQMLFPNLKNSRTTFRLKEDPKTGDKELIITTKTYCKRRNKNKRSK